MPRKLWVLLAFGALVYEAEHRRLDLDALRLEADATGGALGGMETAERLIAHAEERRALLSEHLPYRAPEDWVAAGSRPLFDEYQRKVREIGHRFDPTLDENDARLLRRQTTCRYSEASGRSERSGRCWNCLSTPLQAGPPRPSGSRGPVRNCSAAARRSRRCSTSASRRD